MSSAPGWTLPLCPDWCPVHGQGCECGERKTHAVEMALSFALDSGLEDLSETDWLEYLLEGDAHGV